ncbi:MAG: fasciclin domain-containing protein [Rivularia sp. (in: cyanobacteria)]
MTTQKSALLLNRTSAILIALTSFLINIPAQAACQNNLSTVSQVSASNKTNETGNIVEIAASNPNFKTLVTAVQAADLTETLSGDTKFTVFAPTDAAFAKLPKETLDKLLKPENKAALQQILTYHVVSGTVNSQSLKSGKAKTVEGNPVHVLVNQQNGIRINKSKVIQADIKASNGIIHVIDTVLIPPGF